MGVWGWVVEVKFWRCYWGGKEFCDLGEGRMRIGRLLGAFC